MQALTSDGTATFKPSAYQEAIFRFHADATADAFVSAVAGSGKTTTLVQCAQRLPILSRSRAIFVAFNKHIAEELGRRLPAGVTARTIHSLGREAVQNYIKPPASWRVDGYKYSHLARLFTASLGMNPYSPDARYLANTLEQMMHFVMVTLTDPEDRKAIQELAVHYGVIVDNWQTVLAAIPKMLSWGIMGTDTPDKNGRQFAIEECISYDEMLFLPSYLDLPLTQYDLIYCDEAQDLSAAQREVVLKLRAPKGRIIFVGDPNQAIYAFAGADSRSLQQIMDKTQAVSLPLSICYRCPTSHVDLAKAIVPAIEAHSAAKVGIVADLPAHHLARQLRTHDLILCRTTAPLISMAFHLLESDVPAKVRGRDIGAALVNLVDAVAKTVSFDYRRFHEFLELYQARMVAQYKQQACSELEIESLCDRVDSLRSIHRRKSAQGRAQTLDELFVDYEYFTNINVDFEKQWPSMEGREMIFMIGVGWEWNGQWQYRQFVAEAETREAERDMFEKFLLFLEACGVFASAGNAVLYHWSNAEVWQSRAAAERLGLPHLATLSWFDLQKPFHAGPIALPSCWSFGLKPVAKALGQVSPDHFVEWPESLADGLSASVMGWRMHEQAEPLKSPELGMLSEYLEIDCKAMWAILSWMRAVAVDASGGRG